MSQLRRIEIIGGGLAGLSLGLALRREKVPVTLIEAGDYPRHRVCGEFITGLSATTITHLGLQEILGDALQHREVAWFIGERATRVQQLPAPALGLSRYSLDQRLVQAFVAAGGELQTRTRAADFSDQPGRILATGRRRSRSLWMGLKIHARGLELRRDLELHLGNQAYVGLSRIEGDEVNVCGLFRRRELCAKGANLLVGYLQAAGLTKLADRLLAAETDRASFCAVAAVEFNRRVLRARGAPCLGDACAMIPPFTGNGMAMAFQSAETALPLILNYVRDEMNWGEMSRTLHQRLQRRFRLRLASAGALHPYLLQPGGQRWLARLSRAHLLPLRPLYSLLH